MSSSWRASLGLGQCEGRGAPLGSAEKSVSGTTEIHGAGGCYDKAIQVFDPSTQTWNFSREWKVNRIPCGGARNNQLWHNVD